MGVYVVKDRVWEALGYVPHDAQRTIHNSRTRIRLAAWGRRSGKSTAGGHELVPEAAYTHSILPALQQEGIKRRFWQVGPDYTDGEKEFRVLYDDLKRLEFPFDKPGTYNNPDGGDMKISLFQGAFQVEVKSARYHESLDGEGLFGVQLVEAAKLKPFIWGKYIRPSLADYVGWAWITSTPEGKNWFYKMWQRGQDPADKEVASWRFPSWVNPYLFPEGADDPEILSMRRDMSEERFSQQISADFTDFVGRVFKDFDEEVHVTDIPYDPKLPLYGAVDYGWNNPFVWLGIQMDVWDNVYVIGEYRVTKKDTGEIAREVRDIPWIANAREFFPDPAEPDDSNILSRMLRIPSNPSTGGILKWRLELIRRHLKLDPATEGHPEEKRKPKLFIDRSCVGNPLGDGGLIREMLEYRYPDTKEESVRSEKEEPMDKDNHGPEALGRFFRGRFGPPEDPENHGRARVRKAVMTRG